MLLSSVFFGGKYTCNVRWINKDKIYFLVMGSDRENEGEVERQRVVP